MCNLHIHAFYSGEEIVVFLSDYSVKSRFKNRNMQNEAMNYVINNIDELNVEWIKNRIQ